MPENTTRKPQVVEPDSDSHPASLKGGEPAANSRLRIAELYASLQGEGLLTGVPSIFVRTSGCNLRCWFCDTPHASWNPEGETLELTSVLDSIAACAAAGLAADQISIAETFSIRRDSNAESLTHVVLTGGEPLLFPATISLVRQLRSSGFHVTIETAGTIFQAVDCDLMSISPKLSSSGPRSLSQNSQAVSESQVDEKSGWVAESDPWILRHHQRRHRPEVVRQLMQSSPYQLKFVVDSPSDAEEVVEYLTAIPEAEPSRVLIMPQGIDQGDLDRRSEWLEPWCEARGFVFCPRKQIQWFGNKRRT